MDNRTFADARSVGHATVSGAIATRFPDRSPDMTVSRIGRGADAAADADDARSRRAPVST